MGKKKLSQKQLKRIKANQDAHQQELNNSSTEDSDSSHRALVISRFSNQAIIEDYKQQRYKAGIRRNIEHLTAGDQVIFQKNDDDTVVIVSKIERETVLGRFDKRGKIKPVAANVTQMFIVFAAKPEPSLLLLDTYLLAAETLQIKPILIYNKADIEKPGDEFMYYEQIHYPLLCTSALNKTGFEKLNKFAAHNSSVFVGQSGVGKSTLISSIIPDLELKSQEISEQSELGKHTTSNSTLYHLPQGGHLIDSPGIREFNLSPMPKEAIIKGFIEFAPYIGQCKFKNCQHINEIDCAIIQAAKNNEISQHRVDNYTTILEKYGQ